MLIFYPFPFAEPDCLWIFLLPVDYTKEDNLESVEPGYICTNTQTFAQTHLLILIQRKQRLSDGKERAVA